MELYAWLVVESRAYLRELDDRYFGPTYDGKYRI
jgi:hypothetical protein